MFSKNIAEKARRAVVLAIVLGLVAQSAVAPAMASSTSISTTPDDPCTVDGGDVVENILTLGASGWYDAGQCEGAKQLENATQSDIYRSGLALDDLRKASATNQLNQLDISRTYARTIFKTESVKMFNNQSNDITKAEMKADVNDSIEAYYAKMEKNNAESYRAAVLQTWYDYKAQQDSGLGTDSMTHDKVAIESADISFPWDADAAGSTSLTAMKDGASSWYLKNYTVEFVDGNTSTIPYLMRSDDGTTHYDTTDPYLQNGSTKRVQNIYIKDPQYLGNSETKLGQYTPALEPGYFVKVRMDVQNQTADMKREASGFIDSLYSNYDRSAGETVDVNEVLTANDITTQWNTDYESTGYYGWLAATYGMTSLNGSVESSFAIEYTPRVNHSPDGNVSLDGNGTTDYLYEAGETYNISGTLMTDWAPASTNGSYVVNETYDTANTGDPVIFIEQANENESRPVRLNGTFTIDSLTNLNTSESINSTDLEEQNQQTYNSSTELEEITRLIEYRNESTDLYEAESSAGGGFDLGSVGPFGAGVLGLVALGFLFVAGKLAE